MKGYIDLHCHYLPSVDDGVRSVAEGIALLAGLHRVGFDRVVATPHIRTAMFENRGPALRQTYDALLATPEVRAAASTLPAPRTEPLFTTMVTSPVVALI